MFTSLKLKHFALLLGLLTGAAGATACYALLPNQPNSTRQAPTVASTTVPPVMPQTTPTAPANPAPSSALSAQSEQVVSQTLSIPTSRTGYRAIALDQVAPSRDRLIGEVPSAVVAQLFGSREALTASGYEQIQVRYPQAGQAIAVLTKVGLADDSVGGMRYRIELEANAAEATSQWQVVWVGQQFKCQPGRGQQAWASELCN